MNEVTKNLSYFEQLASRRKKLRKRSGYYWESITRYCDFFSDENLSVLEIGCGTGELIGQINGRKKMGIDFSQKTIEVAKQQFPQVEFQVMQAEDLQLNEQFDLIILSNLIGYVHDVKVVFEQLIKVCHPRTKIIVTYYNFLWEPILKLAESLGLKAKTPLQNWLSQRDISDLLQLSGFEVYRKTQRMLLPVYIPLLSGFINKFIANLPLIRLLTINFFSFAKLISRETFPPVSVSVIIPCKNEAGNVEEAVKKIPSMGTFTEIIFCDDQSTDGTAGKVEGAIKNFPEKNIQLVYGPGICKADNVWTGFEKAKGDILMILDGDLTVPPEELSLFYEAIINGKGEFINGSRMVYPMENKAMRFINLVGNKIFSLFFSYILDINIKDTLCGTKVLWKNDYEQIKKLRGFWSMKDRWGDYELIFGAAKSNLKIIDLPVHYRERKYGETKMKNRLKNGWLMFRMIFIALWKIKFR